MKISRLFLSALAAISAFCASAGDYAAIKAKLAKEPHLPCRVVFNDGVPSFQIGRKNFDRVMQYTCDYPWKYDNPAFVRQIGRLRSSGIHLYTVGFVSCERTTGENVAKEDKTAFSVTGEKTPDKSKRIRELWDHNYLAHDLIEKRIYRSLELDPDAYFMVYLTLSYPNGWWMNRYSDELVRYANAEADSKVILGDFAFKAPSFASKVFREQASDVLRKVVTYLESTPAAKRIYAYRVDHGCFREWFQYGFTDALLPDVSAPMLKAFRSYLKEKYNNDVNALRKAWNQPDVTFETAKIPTEKERLKLGEDFLRDPVEAAPVLDYLRALHKEILDTNLCFNKTVKEASRYRVPVGNYGGYFFGMHFGPEHRHFYNAELLRSNLVDFQISPYMYTKFRKFGESGWGENMFESPALHGVMGILEADTSTHLDKDKARAAHKYANNSTESAMMLARDFGQILARKAGIYWKDFNRQFYDDDDIQKCFAKFSEINKLPSTANKLKSQVVMVGDFESLIYMCARRWDKLYPQVVSDLQTELTHSGTSFETIAFTDLEKPEAQEFKVYIFPNLFYVTPEKLDAIDKLKKAGKTLLFSYAPGYLTSSGRSLSSMNKLLGTNFDKFPGVFKNGSITRVSNFVYYSSDGRWQRAKVQKILRDSGVHIFNNNNEPVIFAGGNFITCHTAKGGKQQLILPGVFKVDQCFPENRSFGETSVIEFTAPAKSTCIFYVR